jgi:hypothetical protein
MEKRYMSKSIEEITEDWEVLFDEVNLSTLLTYPEKTDFGYWFEREIGTDWGWNEHETYFDNGEFDQTMCDVYFFEVTKDQLDMVRKREDWILEQRKKVDKT